MTKQDLPHKYAPVALITGAAQRIGRAIALDLGRGGWTVAVHYNRSADAAADVVAEIKAAGGRAAAFQADLAQEDQMQTLLPAVVGKLGPVGCLVNNASLFDYDSAASATRESWDRHMEVNLRAPFVLSQAMARLLPAEALGAVVNIIDERVWNLTPHFVTYTLSKAGLWTMTQTLALALAPRIRVNGIGPGPTLANHRQSEEQFRRQCESMPLERGTTPEEICDAVRFILGAPAMTGQMIALDGGQHLGWVQSPQHARHGHEIFD